MQVCVAPGATGAEGQDTSAVSSLTTAPVGQVTLPSFRTAISNRSTSPTASKLPVSAVLATLIAGAEAGPLTCALLLRVSCALFGSRARALAVFVSGVPAAALSTSACVTV